MKPNTTEKLSDRWTYPEHETLHREVDRLNFADVSGWAKATTWFKRPEVPQQIRTSQPVHNLGQLRQKSCAKAKVETGKTVMIATCETKFSEVEFFAKNNRRTVEVCSTQSKVFAKRVRTPKAIAKAMKEKMEAEVKVIREKKRKARLERERLRIETARWLKQTGGQGIDPAPETEADKARKAWLESKRHLVIPRD